jgi:hypothetical protein
MIYGTFESQLAQRGASNVVRSSETKTTTFEYQGNLWSCVVREARKMTQELADGYEMNYCLELYCQKAASA